MVLVREGICTVRLELWVGFCVIEVMTWALDGLDASCM